MALSWSTAAQAQLAGGNVRACAFLRIGGGIPVRIWGGVGDFAVSADNIETTDGAVYQGFGDVLSWPQVAQLVNGQAERVEFSLSAAFITPAIANLAQASAAQIRAATVNLGFLVLGDDLQPVSPMEWIWAGVADTFTISRQSASADQVVRTLSLSVGSNMTGRRRPSPEFYTDASQQARSSGDLFCQYVAGYNAGSTRVWPN